MHTTLLCLCSEEGLGRVDITSMTHQTLMELLIEKMSDDHRQEFHDKSGEFQDVCEWDGVECDNDENVVKIGWDKRFEDEFEMQFQWLPPTVEKFNADTSSLEGSLDTRALPQSLKEFSAV